MKHQYLVNTYKILYTILIALLIFATISRSFVRIESNIELWQCLCMSLYAIFLCMFMAVSGTMLYDISSNRMIQMLGH